MLLAYIHPNVELIRKFIKKSTFTGLAGCALLMSSKFNLLYGFDHPPKSDEIPDPWKLNYCGYTCPADCKFLKATKTNNFELKKEAYHDWHLKERYNVEFDEKKTICWGCKVENDKIGDVAGNCAVRKCAIKKGYQACIQCETLITCNKDLWTRFPDFHKSVIEMQKKYKG